jgi:hypothetical protein
LDFHSDIKLGEQGENSVGVMRLALGVDLRVWENPAFVRVIERVLIESRGIFAVPAGKPENELVGTGSQEFFWDTEKCPLAKHHHVI